MTTEIPYFQPAPGSLTCQGCGKPIAEHSPLLQCMPRDGSLSLRQRQTMATEAGMLYGRAPDDHWIECTQAQAVSLLQDLLGIRVAMRDHAEAPELLKALKAALLWTDEEFDVAEWRHDARSAIAKATGAQA